MANLKLNNVVAIAESAGAPTLQNTIIKGLPVLGIKLLDIDKWDDMKKIKTIFKEVYGDT